MKVKFLSAAAMAAMLLSLSSCGNMMPAAGNQNASTTGAAQASNVGALGQVLLGILSSKLIPTESQILGTWVYQSPAVIFTSENALSKLGGTVASSGIEKKMQTYLNNYGITSGNTSITFNKDKTFVANVRGKNISGKYTISGQTVQMTFDGQSAASKLTPQLDNGSLVIAGDATKIMTFMQGLGANSNNAQVSSITTLMKQFNGMQLGIRLQKK